MIHELQEYIANFDNPTWNMQHYGVCTFLDTHWGTPSSAYYCTVRRRYSKIHANSTALGDASSSVSYPVSGGYSRYLQASEDSTMCTGEYGQLRLEYAKNLLEYLEEACK